MSNQNSKNEKNAVANPNVQAKDSNWKESTAKTGDELAAEYLKANPNVAPQAGKAETKSGKAEDPNFIDEWQDVPLKTVMLGEDTEADEKRHFRFANFDFQRASISRNELGVKITTGSSVVTLDGSKRSIAKDLRDRAKKRKELSLKQLQPIAKQLEAFGRSLTSETDKHSHTWEDGTQTIVPMGVVYGETMVGLVREMASGGKDKYFTRKAFETVKSGGTVAASGIQTESGSLYLELKRAAFDNGKQMEKFVSIVCNAARLAYEGSLILANNKLDLLAKEYAVAFGFGSSEVEVAAMLELFATVIQLRIFGATSQAYTTLAGELEKEAKEAEQAAALERQSQENIERSRTAKPKEDKSYADVPKVPAIAETAKA